MQGSKKKELRRKRGTQKRKGLRKKSSDEKRGTPEMHGANKLTFDERRGTPETQGAKEGDVHIKNRMNTRWNERGGCTMSRPLGLGTRARWPITNAV
jgi:hypothetical protein